MSRHLRVSLVVGMMIGAGIVLPRMVATREPARELRVVAKDMTYYVEGVAGPNPALQFSPGESVRITFRNDDKGMAHDFGIPAWNVGTGVVAWSTEKSITVRVPHTAGAAGYVCTPHSAMMSGQITIAK